MIELEWRRDEDEVFDIQPRRTKQICFTGL